MTPLLFLLAAMPAGQLPPAPEERPAVKPDMVLRWNAIALETIRVERTPPPMAARNLAIVHAAVYDAVNAIVQTHEPYRVALKPVTGASAEAAAVVAAHRTLVQLYPGQRRPLDEAAIRSLDEIGDAAQRWRGIEVGITVADRILEWRAGDALVLGGKHSPRKALGIWQPTPPGFGEALLPNWVHLKPFAIREGILPRPAGPAALTSPAYAAAFREVKALGGKHSASRSPEQTQIAHFWADGEGTSTPPGHWNHIARDVSLARGLSLAENARLLALLNISLADAGLACWIIKFHHEFWRPITGIHLAAHDGNPDTDADASWEPLLPTPPFPAYTSGHSTFSGAAESILSRFFGADRVRFESAAEGLPGVKRVFESFSAAAEEAGRSRIYGGIHWEFDNRDGLANGRAVGDFVWRHHLRSR